MGALLVNEQFQEVASLVQFVKPTVNPQLSAFAQQLTNVTQLQLDQYGVSFKEALERFVEFAKPAQAIICMNRDSGVF
ncbi:MAG: hypothetical protein KDD62_12000, partial [Bdellovibrionales bacterium]|nr:hypothetical protein [Bdellovibrionales bacterium]